MNENLKKIYEDIFSVPSGKRKSNFRKYFPYCKEADFRKKIDLLMKEYYEANGSYEFDNEMYAAAIKGVVSSYTNNKDTLISVYKKFNKYIIDECNQTIEIKYPPIPISNTFERLMFIAKYLQDDSHLISDLPDVLWVSQRTIETDLAKLQGNDDDPLQVCGKKFVIDVMDRSMGRMSFGSTAHPFFLTSNLTQVIVMLEGLREMSKRPEYKGYAMPLARDIWSQLSDYGRNRIDFVSKNLMNLDQEWYGSLDSYDEFMYITEAECSYQGDSALLYSLKNENKKTCVIEYENEDGTEFFTDVKLVRFTEAGIEVEIEGKVRVLDPQRIIRSSFNKENMY